MAERGRIRRLPEDVINKIAAGEVVERPASALKELVENALDAGAASVHVDLRDGGAALVRVRDDGVGMTPDELVLALERHATSKLPHDADLDAIATLGFRGEALPAICGVSRFTITTRARGAAEGIRVAGAGGVVDQRLSVVADEGTTVEVGDLFFNTPARLKFLKSATTELTAAQRAVAALALAHPGVQFRLTHNGRAVLTAPRAVDLRARAGAVWGYELAERLVPIAREEHGLSVAGLGSPPDATRGSREDVILVVNGRPVRDPGLFQAVIAGYRPLLPRDRFPLVVLVLTVPLADVDVNVHPTKAWVRFRHPRLVHEIVAAAVGEALRARSAAPATTVAFPAMASAAEGPAPEVGEQPALFAEAPAPYASSSFGRVLGQVQDTFVVAATESEVFFVDQHAAHERVIFERLRSEMAAGTPAAQALLFPAPVHLTPAARTLLGRWQGPLARLGLTFEEFGGDAVVLRTVPALLKDDEPVRLVEAAVDQLGDGPPGEVVLDRVLAFVACRAAIKAPASLPREAMERLVADLATTSTPYFCPHGRPTMSRVSLQEIRRDVRRLW